jgi:hypothetical protein
VTAKTALQGNTNHQLGLMAALDALQGRTAFNLKQPQAAVAFHA